MMRPSAHDPTQVWRLLVTTATHRRLLTGNGAIHWKG